MHVFHDRGKSQRHVISVYCTLSFLVLCSVVTLQQNYDEAESLSDCEGNFFLINGLGIVFMNSVRYVNLDLVLILDKVIICVVVYIYY